MMVAWAGRCFRENKIQVKASMKAEPLIIATVPRTRVLVIVLAVLAVGALVIYCWIDAAQDWGDFFSRPYKSWAVPFITLSWFSLLPIAVKGSRQILSHGGRTVWIEDGRLIFFYPSYFSAPLTEIYALSLTCDFWGWDQIRISLRNGGECKFHLARMSIPSDAIVKRLREICGLPEPGPEQSV
jgi:hypothetical protein